MSELASEYLSRTGDSRTVASSHREEGKEHTTSLPAARHKRAARARWLPMGTMAYGWVHVAHASEAAQHFPKLGGPRP